MDVTPSGITRSFISALEKALLPMEVTEEGIVTLVSEEQPSNALVSILVTVLGISIDLSHVQLLNKLLGIALIPFPKVTVSIESQAVKAVFMSFAVYATMEFQTVQRYCDRKQVNVERKFVDTENASANAACNYNGRAC